MLKLAIGATSLPARKNFLNRRIKAGKNIPCLLLTKTSLILKINSKLISFMNCGTPQTC